MKPLAGLCLMILAPALLALGCGSDTPASNANLDTVSNAEHRAISAKCDCLISVGEYVSTDDCIGEQIPSPKTAEWLACANEVVKDGDYGNAMECWAASYDQAVACIEDVPCSSDTTYSLSVTACIAQYAETPDCAGLTAANDAIAAACDGGTGGGGGLDGGLRRLGELCLTSADCIDGFCLESEYGAPFCTRTCDEPQVDCPAGDDADIGESLCVSFAKDQLPYPDLVEDFQGQEVGKTGNIDTFCVPRCTSLSSCREHNESWETCATPKYKANEIYPGLGAGGNICQAPSHHGKDPVDPTACNYEKTIGNFGGEASICGFYCDFLETCLFIEKDVFPAGCCEWGCFSRMVPEGDVVDDGWYDDVKCYVDDHNAWPPVGVDNYCNHPPKACGGQPVDPTHPAARPL